MVNSYGNETNNMCITFERHVNENNQFLLNSRKYDAFPLVHEHIFTSYLLSLVMFIPIFQRKIENKIEEPVNLFSNRRENQFINL